MSERDRWMPLFEALFRQDIGRAFVEARMLFPLLTEGCNESAPCSLCSWASARGWYVKEEENIHSAHTEGRVHV